MAQYGKNFSLNSDPRSFNFAGFNYNNKDTDFEYARLRTEAQVYSYAYNNQTISSTDPTGLTQPGTKVGAAGNANIPGVDKQNQYRVYGGMFKAEQVLAAGLLRAGLVSRGSRRLPRVRSRSYWWRSVSECSTHRPARSRPAANTCSALNMPP